MKQRVPISVGCATALMLVALGMTTCCHAVETGRRSSSMWPGADLFTNGMIPRLRVELSPEAAARLRDKPRDYVPATVNEGDTVYRQVGVHLKGSTGSFRALDDKPSLTLDFARFQEGQRFHGLRKIHLNNSVEDPGYVNEIIGGEMFRANGVPTPRATRALVAINGQNRGLYVLKEGFTEDFLSCHFKRISRELYEPENGHDVDQKLKRNSVFGSETVPGALKGLADAAQETDVALRWQRLETVLDLGQFLKFMSLEIMLGHRDGYCLARNNFRVYHDLDSGKMIFFPHGMDQLFGSADLPWQPALGGLVANAVMSTAEGNQRYVECFRSLFAGAFKVETLTNRVDQLVQELRPHLDASQWRGIQEAAREVKDRIVQRQRSLILQLNQPPLVLMEFVSGIARLENWRVAEVPAKGRMNDVDDLRGSRALHIATSSETVASWRATALLPPGRYRFEGRVRIASVEPLAYGVHHGASLRIRGGERRAASFIGDSEWRLLTEEFQVAQSVEEVEFICELRARAGEAWFDLSSLQVRRTGDL